jgi:hypothetical protein
VVQYHVELSIVSKLARHQFNGLRVPGTCECSARGIILTVEIYKEYYLLILIGSVSSEH